jgi:hypothetical protein
VPTPGGRHDVHGLAIVESVFAAADENGIKIHDPKIIKGNRKEVERISVD